MEMKVYTIEQADKWDSIVRTFKDYDVYWLSGYVKAFQIHGDGDPLLFYYEDKATRGINVVFKRDVANDIHFKGKIQENEYFDFATPYGYGGWIIEGDNKDSLFNAYEKWCVDNGIISEFVRFHPVIQNQVFAENNYEIIPLGLTIAMDLHSPEVIWENIISKNRNMIRKAEKSGIKIFSGRSEQLYKEFIGIYNSTMDHDNAEEYYYFKPAFYESICNDLPENAQIFYAVKDEEIIAASIIMSANGRMNYHLSGSKFEYRNLAPSNLLLYKIALWGCANGCRTFYLGGGVGSGEDNLYKFKKSFYRRDDLFRFYIGKKIYLQDKYNKLVQLRGIIERNYFPQYRA